MKDFLCSPLPGFLPHWHFYLEESIWFFWVQIKCFLSQGGVFESSLRSHGNVISSFESCNPFLSAATSASTALVRVSILSPSESLLPALLPLSLPLQSLLLQQEQIFKYRSVQVFPVFQITQWLPVSLRVKIKFLTVGSK